MLLKNKVILITGSTLGIGKAAALRCIKEGAKVMLHGLEKDLGKKICKDLGENVKFCSYDLSSVKACYLLIDEVLKEFGSLDGLVNNAGIYPRHELESITEKAFDDIFALNIKAPLFLSQAAIKYFKQQQSDAVIVNIGSINAYCGAEKLLLYSMTKGALMTMTRNMADSFSNKKIRINCLNVGWTLTDGELKIRKGQGSGEEWIDKTHSMHAPIGRILLPEEIANHIVFWLSSQSYPITGAVYELEQYPIIGRNHD